MKGTVEDGGGNRGRWLRFGVIVALSVAYVAAGYYVHRALRSDQVYTHLAYVPIVLAGLWWGRRGLIVAGVLAAVVFAYHLLNLGGRIWDDAARTVLFIVVGLCVAWLSERAAGSERVVRLSEERYRLLTEKSLAGICVYRDERVLFANARLGDMLGYAPEDLRGRSIWEFIHEPDRPKVRDLLARRRAEGFSDLHYECRFVKSDGRVIWTDLASSVAEWDGSPAVFVNLYDITAMREAQEKRQELSDLAQKQEEQLVHSTRLAELGEMAAAVAHELNQPLTGIRTFARNAFYMLDQGAGTPDEVKDNLRLIAEQVDRAAKIISQMRELTRRSERHFAPVDVNGTLRESVEFLMPQLRLSGVEVELDLAADLPEVMGDRIRLEQVFLNLITNARQAMEESAERRLTVTSRLERSGDSMPDARSQTGDNRPMLSPDLSVVVEVADTGRGFAPEVGEKLFTPFFSTKKAGHGTGLGLSISLTIVKDHQGTIEGHGEPGKGARFTVRLPAGRE